MRGGAVTARRHRRHREFGRLGPVRLVAGHLLPGPVIWADSTAGTASSQLLKAISGSNLRAYADTDGWARGAGQLTRRPFSFRGDHGYLRTNAQDDIMPSLLPALGQAVTFGRARPVHFVQCGNYSPHRKADVAVLLFHLRDALTTGSWHMGGAGCPVPDQGAALVLSLFDGKGSLPGDDGPCPVCGTMCD